MAVDVRGIAEHELRAWLDAVEVAFGETITDAQFTEAAKIFEVPRVAAAFDGERCVGGGGVFTFRLSVPGGREVGAAGVTAVGVMPTHRRQGILRRVMAKMLADAKAAGEPVAILWASEGTIYQRFGYGLASLNGGFDLPRARATFRVAAQPAGTVALVERAAARAAFPGVYDQVLRQTPGFPSRSDAWWDEVLSDPEHRRRGASAKFYALYSRPDGPAGYAWYRIKAEWGEGKSEVRVLELMGIDAAATRDMWQYIFGIDLMDRIKVHLGPPDQPLLLQLSHPEQLGLRAGDGLWLRILDVPEALAGRSYAADGELVIDVSDDFMPEVGGRFRLRVADGQATVEPTTVAPDLALEVNDLGSVYLGGFSFTDLARAGRGKERTPGARAQGDRMFASDRKPWCPWIF